MANVRKKQIEHAPAEDAEELPEVGAPGIAIEGAPVAAASESVEEPATAPADAAEPVAEASDEAEVAAEVAAAQPASEPASEPVAPSAAASAESSPAVAEATATPNAASSSKPAASSSKKKPFGKKKEDENLDPIEKAKAEAKEAREKAEKTAAAAVASAGNSGIMGRRSASKARREAKYAERDAREKEHMAEVEVQRAKNEVYFEKAMNLSAAEDEALDEFESQVEDIEFEDEFLTDDEIAAKKGDKKHARKEKPKGKFTTQANNITGDAATIITLQSKQREFFDSRRPVKADWRKTALVRLHNLIKKYETPLIEALHRDLGITRYEAYLTELAPIHAEFKLLRDNIEKFANPRKMRINWKLFPTMFKECWQPHGTVCIINSWESPVAMPIIALADAIAAGNVVTIKNSPRTKRCNEVLSSAMAELFKTDYVRFVFGGADMDAALLAAPYDKTFYVGPKENAVKVMEANIDAPAPVTLLLDGNNACYVDSTANIETAAEKVMWGKMLHAGQTRYAPHYAFVSDSVHKTFVNRTFAYVERVYGKDPIHSKGYPRMFSNKEFDEACEILDNLGPKAKIVYGGERDAKTLRIAPTVVLCESMDNPLFKRKIVGPILVVGTFRRAEEAFGHINQLPTPPALYMFTTHKGSKKFAMMNVHFGQACINDCAIQVLNRRGAHSATGSAGRATMGGINGLDEFGTRRIVAISGKGGSMKSWRKTPFPLEGYDKIKKVYKFFNSQ